MKMYKLPYFDATKIPLLLFLCLFVSGCASTGSPPNPFSSVNKKPSRTVAVWSPAVLNGERGFAGRVTFFDDHDKIKAVKAEGDLVVYAFHERPHRSASDNAPDKTYPIPAEELKNLETQSKKLGYSYSVWVPWDADLPGDAERQDVSLIVKLVPKNGGTTVMSGQARVLLPGKEPQFDDMLYAQQNGGISQVSYEFGNRDRYDENLPQGYRDWTRKPRFGESWTTTPEEREIRTGNRPNRMITTTIPIVKPQYEGAVASHTRDSRGVANPTQSGSFAPVAYHGEVSANSEVNNAGYTQPPATDVQVYDNQYYGNPLVR